MKKLELFKEKPWILFFLSMLTACSPLKEENSSNIIIPRIENTSDADNASYTEGKIITQGQCLYIEFIDGSKVLPIFATKTASWDEKNKSLIVDSETYLLGDKVAYGGGESFPLEKSHYSWKVEASDRCDISRAIIINKIFRPLIPN